MLCATGLASVPRVTNPTALAAVALLAGVVAGVWLPVPLAGVGVGLVVVWALAIGVVMRRARPMPVSVVLAVGFTLGGLVLGVTRHAAAVETPLARWFADQPGADTGRVGPVLLEGRLGADATTTDYGAALRLTVERVGRVGAMQPTSGGVRLSVGGRLWSGRVAAWRAGRVVRVWATLRQPAAYRNPGMADQARRQAVRGTALLGLVKSGLLIDVMQQGPPPAELAAAVREWVRQVIGRAVGRHGTRSAPSSPRSSLATAPVSTQTPPAGCRRAAPTTSLPFRVATSSSSPGASCCSAGRPACVLAGCRWR